MEQRQFRGSPAHYGAAADTMHISMCSGGTMGENQAPPSSHNLFLGNSQLSPLQQL
jgi:hypothetical protein